MDNMNKKYIKHPSPKINQWWIRAQRKIPIIEMTGVVLIFHLDLWKNKKQIKSPFPKIAVELARKTKRNISVSIIEIGGGEGGGEGILILHLNCPRL